MAPGGRLHKYSHLIWSGPGHRERLRVGGVGAAAGRPREGLPRVGVASCLRGLFPSRRRAAGVDAGGCSWKPRCARGRGAGPASGVHCVTKGRGCGTQQQVTKGTLDGGLN